MKKFVVFAAAIAIAGTSAAAQQSQGGMQTQGTTGKMDPSAVFARWDTDDDKRVSKNEFLAGLRDVGWFGRTDRNNDNRITKQEFHAQMKALNVYKKADLDNSGSVEMNEVKRLIGEAKPGWNDKPAGSLTESELYDGVYSAWDTDDSGFLTEEEYAYGVYGYVDEDDDGWLSEDEFEEGSDFLW